MKVRATQIDFWTSKDAAFGPVLHVRWNGSAWRGAEVKDQPIANRLLIRNNVLKQFLNRPDKHPIHIILHWVAQSSPWTASSGWTFLQSANWEITAILKRR